MTDPPKNPEGQVTLTDFADREIFLMRLEAKWQLRKGYCCVVPQSLTRIAPETRGRKP